MLFFLLHFLIIIGLTVITQIGGIIYLISLLMINSKKTRYRLKRFLIFCALYGLATFLIVPILAPSFGRVQIDNTALVKANSIFYLLANRNYVKPELNTLIQNITSQLQESNPGVKLVYLDANFPFIDKFPLLPHLSHNDGKKIDLSFVYKDETGQWTNKKPSVSGYGIYEGPNASEFDQTAACKGIGYWQYDFPKYLSFGQLNSGLSFSEEKTKRLIQLIVSQPQIGKVFIEPHLKSRLGLTNNKIRFHGCGAVRHDDHIHMQLK